MEDNVFFSKFKRRQENLENNLYDLIKVQSAKPTKRERLQDELVCNFLPDCDKLYIPKKRIYKTIKVKTVRDIRNEFEHDIYIDLPKDLERQQTVLLKKITAGSSNANDTKTLAMNLMKSGNPLNRETWQMITNINPYRHTHSTQYVLWNGKRIRVTGSKGGNTMYLCNCDLSSKGRSQKHTASSINKKLFKKKGLLQNSLTVKFKPGPLSRKVLLDASFQKYNVGTTELVQLPKIGLYVSPKSGVMFPPAVTNILQNFRTPDGTISEKWAEFAVSMLQPVNNSNSSLPALEDSVTFGLNYQSEQYVLLMRHLDIFKNNCTKISNVLMSNKKVDSSVIKSEVSSVLNCILDAVDISINQDNFYSGLDVPREVIPEDIIKTKRNSIGKEKIKRNLELDRLDVTVIRLPQNEQDDNEPCRKSYCSYGCICSSIESNYHLRNHCGRIECMFECNCNFSNYNFSDSFENDCPELLQGLISMDSAMNLRLAKEEMKFHQTVVLTGEKSIILKSQKRNCKASKRYAEYFDSKLLKPGITKHAILSLNKLNCTNLEPWCMVHNLYKCFCKGKFIGDQLKKDEEDRLWLSKELEEVNSKNTSDFEGCSDADKQFMANTDKQFSANTDKLFSFSVKYPEICARTKPFSGRKFKASFYSQINKKIRDLEANDTKLHKRIANITNTMQLRNKNDDHGNLNSNDNNDSNLTDIINISDSSLSNDEPINHELAPETSHNDFTVNTSSSSKELKKPIQDKANIIQDKDDILNSRHVPAKSVLTSWLETSYRLYKQRLDKGNFKIVLDPPKQGKMALYPWEFILSRYRDRKNLFLISKKEPYRIFMAVDLKNYFFKNCMNIDDIRLADLHKYPVTVRNLLTNATELKDNFCILFGLQICWELVGSVTKVNEQSECDSVKPNLTHSLFLKNDGDDDLESDENISLQLNETNQEDESAAGAVAVEANKSKWFIMTVENDFSEIQFSNRGFFVKHDSLMKSITVARSTGNTIRLSPKGPEHQTLPQFGIYAVPNTNEHCVFVGPYEKDEVLGIEVVTSISLFRKQNRTRGFWITTSTVDNYKVIDNPLSFMPTSKCNSRELVNIVDCNDDINEDEGTNKTNTSKSNNTVPPLPRPIKAQYVIVKKAFPDKPKVIKKSQLSSLSKNPKDVVPQSIKKYANNKMPLQEGSSSVQSADSKKPIAEIAPQVKTINLSDTFQKNIAEKRTERGMLVLKPEEINQRSMKASSSLPSTSDVEMKQDIENFLATSEVCTLPDADNIYEISDDEDDNKLQIKQVCIECVNIQNMGWIKGRKNQDNFISFAFPGFKYTNFVSTELAFTMINMVLSRKIFVPKQLEVSWRIVDSEKDLKNNINMLKLDSFGKDFVLTKLGPKHKSDLVSFCV